MPIKVEDAKKYKGYEEDEVRIANFLTENKSKAFTEEEIEKGIGKKSLAYAPNEKGSYWTLENVGNLTLNMLNGLFLRDTLKQMVKKGRIRVSEVAGKNITS